VWQAESIVGILEAELGADLVHQAHSEVVLDLLLDLFPDLFEIGGLWVSMVSIV